MTRMLGRLSAIGCRAFGSAATTEMAAGSICASHRVAQRAGYFATAGAARGGGRAPGGGPPAAPPPRARRAGRAPAGLSPRPAPAARAPSRPARAAAAVEAAKAMTFADCATAYINAHEAGWRNPKHRQQWKNTLATYVSPVVGKLPVSAVDTGLVLKVLEPIWTRKPETASRVR